MLLIIFFSNSLSDKYFFGLVGNLYDIYAWNCNGNSYSSLYRTTINANALYVIDRKISACDAADFYVVSNYFYGIILCIRRFYGCYINPDDIVCRPIRGSLVGLHTAKRYFDVCYICSGKNIVLKCRRHSCQRSDS